MKPSFRTSAYFFALIKPIIDEVKPMKYTSAKKYTAWLSFKTLSNGKKVKGSIKKTKIINKKIAAMVEKTFVFFVNE